MKRNGRKFSVVVVALHTIYSMKCSKNKTVYQIKNSHISEFKVTKEKLLEHS